MCGSEIYGRLFGVTCLYETLDIGCSFGDFDRSSLRQLCREWRRCIDI